MRLLIVLAVVGCGNSKDNAPAPAPDKPAVFDGPMPIAFGDCADAKTMWVSGPRPLPPDRDLADPPPPPEDDDTADASGGAGQAMALDEGKMGHLPSGDEMRETRQQAIDAARAAGILGAPSDRKRPADRQPSIFAGLPGRSANLGGGFDAGPESTLGVGTIDRNRKFDAGPGPAFKAGPIGAHHGAFPIVSIDPPTLDNDLDKGTIRRYVKRDLTKISNCYEKQLIAKPTLNGKVTATFFIRPDGAVVDAKASGMDAEVASCIAKIISNMHFPKPKGGGGVSVTYPFLFKPAATADNAGSSGSGSPPPAPPAPPPEPAHLFRGATIDDPMYRPGASNPLRAFDSALASCLRSNPKRYGVVVVEGRSIYGIDDAATRACVLGAIKFPSSDRCSFAFGVMPVTELPALEITSDAVSFNGKPLATPDAIAKADNKPDAHVEAAIAASVAAATAPSAPVVALHGPIVVRAIESTPVGVLDRVLAGVLAGGDDFVLATNHGGDWQLLDKLDLPVAPVPLGRGGEWNRVKGSLGAPFGVDDHVRLSVLIAKQTITVGVSRVDEFVAIARDATQWTNLVAELKKQKAGSFFGERTDIEIAGDDDVTYGDLVRVIEAAKAAGFIDWELTDPPGLSARPKP